jgi:hypothetical protein
MDSYSRMLRVVIIFLVCVCWTKAGAASSIRDPQVIIGGGHGSLPVGSSFKFVSPTGTSPVSLANGSPCVVASTKKNIPVPDCLFRNESGFRWDTLTFNISPTGQAGPFSCAALAFFSGCVFNEEGSKVTFFGGTGIGPGDYFVVAVIAWAPRTVFRGTGAATTAWGTGNVPRKHAPIPPSEPRTPDLLTQGNVAFVRQAGEPVVRAVCS